MLWPRLCLFMTLLVRNLDIMYVCTHTVSAYECVCLVVMQPGCHVPQLQREREGEEKKRRERRIERDINLMCRELMSWS